MNTKRQPQPALVARPDAIEAAMRPIGKASKKFWATIFILTAIVALGIFAWIVQLRDGMGVAGYNDRSFWAIYIADVVAFIGVSYGGAVVSAILLLTGADWRAPLARLSEGMALVTVLVGAAFIFPHLGRPGRLLGMVTQPNFASPVFWDMVAIVTYLSVTFVFFMLPLVPDTAILRGARPDELGKWRTRLYRLISRNWSGSTHQRTVLRSASLIVAILIIPLAVSVHSVLSWAFSLVSRPGWHESIWAPYFVIAALYSGVALVIIVVACFRRGYHLEGLITEKHFVSLGYIMAALGAVYLYLTFADLLPSAYVSEPGPNAVIRGMLSGDAAPWFWLFIVAGTLLPMLLVAVPATRTITGIVIASTLVVVALWIKRLMMVLETAGYDRLSEDFGDGFHFTWVSVSITLAGVAAIPLLLMLLFRIFPLVAIDEITELSGTAGVPPTGDESAARTTKGHTRAGIVAGVLMVVGFSAAAVATARPAQADEGAATPTVSVAAAVAGPEVTVTATVMADGEPVRDALVTFYQSTPMFAPGDNRVPLGEVGTGPDGSAELIYVPTEAGQVTISVTYYADIEGEPATAETPLTITEATSPYVPPVERPLQSAGHAIVPILFSLVLVVFLVVITQVVRVRRACGITDDEAQADVGDGA
ncbi:MAG: NrfD/PsrC family molybdoenzyme membrane anchor subunit [Nocardioides sp.]